MRSTSAILMLVVLWSCKDDHKNHNVLHRHVVQQVRQDNMEVSKVSNQVNDGIVYFSFDDGASWENRSDGLPPGMNLTEIAAAENLLVASSKQNGLFVFDFQKNRWNGMEAQPATEKNIDAIGFHREKIFAGTGGGGIFISINKGKTWIPYNKGLQNLTVRRIALIDDQMWIGTNGGLYILNDRENKWELVFGDNALQVNGIVQFKDALYIGTNRGVYKSEKKHQYWEHVMKNMAAHNISFDSQYVYALAYNELIASADEGANWHSVQMGLPKDLYSFQLKQKDANVFVGQWDGVYKRSGVVNWIRSSDGMPRKFPVTELVIYQDLIIAGSSAWIKYEK